MKLSFTVFICLMASKLSSAHSVTIKCEYNIYNSYACNVLNTEVFTGDRVSIEKAEGKHEEGKTDDDVQYLGIFNAENLKYFPTNLNNVFKKLKEIQIFDTNLIEITSEDLKVFPKLKRLKLAFNKIEIIRDGTFDFNQELKAISLKKNKISHIDPTAFSKLPKLESLWLVNNVCDFDVAWGVTTMKEKENN